MVRCTFKNRKYYREYWSVTAETEEAAWDELVKQFHSRDGWTLLSSLEV